MKLTTFQNVALFGCGSGVLHCVIELNWLTFFRNP